MAFERNYILNELLYFTINNINLCENEEFLDNVVSFYSTKDINTAKQQLVTDFEKFNINFQKPTARGDSKKDKLLDIINLIKHAFNNNYSDKIPVYFSVNYKKIPTYIAIMNFNFNIIHNNIRHLENLLKETNVQKIANKSKPVENVNINCACNCIDKQSCTCKIEKTKICSTNLDCISRADMVKESFELKAGNSTTDNDNDFTEVRNKKNKRKRFSQSPNSFQKETHLSNPPLTNKIEPKKFKLIGTSTASKLKSSKIYDEKIKKKAFYLGNVDRCKKENIEEHLNENGIKFNVIFPLFRKTPKDSQTTITSENSENIDKETASTAFKIILPESEVNKLLNPDIWYQSTYLCEWDFQKKKSTEKP